MLTPHRIPYGYSMKIRVLSSDDVKKSLPMKTAIEVTKRAFSSLSSRKVEMPFRSRINVPKQDGVLLTMPAALLDDGGGAVTWTANTPLWIIENGHGKAANQFAAGVGPYGGPATTEAITPAATFYSSGARDIHVNFRAQGADLATAATTVKVIMTFLYALHFYKSNLHP